jgi:bifunctional non-homologous end joining protein LigD
MNTAAESRVRRLAEAIPITYMIFDLMHLDGHSALKIPYTERRRLLEGLELAGPHWSTPPSETGGGEVILRAASDAGLEGVVAKRLDSIYRPGRRDKSWLKVKNFRTQSVVIGVGRPDRVIWKAIWARCCWGFPVLAGSVSWAGSVAA